MTAFDVQYLHLAETLSHEMLDRFRDDAGGAFFDTPWDASALVVRPRGLFDNPIPSGNSAAAFAFSRLEALTGDPSYGEHARSIFRTARKVLTGAPLAVSYMLSALDFHLSPPVQIALAGAPEDAATGELVRTVFQRYLPNAVIAVGSPESMPLLAHRELRDGQSTAYVCRHFVCELPVTDAVHLGRQLDALSG